MKIIDPSYEILTPLSKDAIIFIEKVARTCYKSEDKIEKGSAERMMKLLIRNGHEAMIEFSDITVKFVHNRGFTHEMVRHRPCSFAQESTRYCNYSDAKFGKQITIIKPYWWNDITEQGLLDWIYAIDTCEATYFNLIAEGLKPQAARGVLPNDLKTEINVKANIREWRHIFHERTSPAAHPDMRRVMIPLLEDFKQGIPVLFDDIIPQEE